MCNKSQRTSLWILPTAIVLGCVCGCSLLAESLAPITQASLSLAGIISTIFINLLKLVSLPIIFLAIVTTISGLNNFDELKFIGGKVLKYTLLTTILAASIALLLFLWLDPVSVGHTLQLQTSTQATNATHSYLNYLIKIVPANFVQTFADNNVIGTLFIAAGFGLATLALPKENRETLHLFFSSAYAAIFQMTLWILKLVPIAVWAFTALFIQDLITNKLQIGSLSVYLTCVVAANLIQALFVLPALLKLKGISPIQTAKHMLNYVIN